MALNNIYSRVTFIHTGELLWLSGKVVKNEKINKIKRTRVRSPPRATSLKKYFHTYVRFFHFII
jgi:hypothetical protein